MSARKVASFVSAIVPDTGVGKGPAHLAVSMVATLWPASRWRPTFLNRMCRTLPERVWAGSVRPMVSVPSGAGRIQTSRGTSKYSSGGMSQPR